LGKIKALKRYPGGCLLPLGIGWESVAWRAVRRAGNNNCIGGK